MAKDIDQLSVEEIDAELSKRGDKIAQLREEQRPYLEAKNRLAAEETEAIRAAGTTTTVGEN